MTEMANFTKKHHDWRDVLKILNRLYLDWGDQKFIPHFQTFINQRQWEMFDIKKKRSTNPYGTEFDWRSNYE